jgi:hypothetical protein
MDDSSEGRAGLPKEPRPDRRASVRFPLTLDVRYSVSHRGASVEKGSGQTILGDHPKPAIDDHLKTGQR